MHSLWAGPEWACSEDLSDAGLQQKHIALSLLQNKIEKELKGDNNVISQAALGELLRFTHGQMAVHKKNPYKTHTTAYLKLCSFALLPPYCTWVFQSDMSYYSHENTEAQIKKCLGWIAICEERIRNSQITFAKNDHTIIRQIISSLREVPFSILEESQLLCEKLNGLTNLGSGKISNDGLHVDIRKYVCTVLGYQSSIEKLMSNLHSFLEEGINKLARTNEKKEAVPLGTYNDSNNYPKLFQNIRECIAEKTLTNIGPDGKIIKMPPFMEPFGAEALFLPGTIAQLADHHVILMFRDTHFQSATHWRENIYPLLILAHELCPGHGEHFRRALTSPLSEVFQITQSPIGFEGWASFGEGRIAALDNNFHGLADLIHYRRVRRLFAAFKLIGKIVLGEKESERILQNFLQHLHSTYANLLASMSMEVCLHLLPYGIGIVETEKSLRMIAERKGMQAVDASCIEEYLHYGPLIPSSIRALALKVDTQEGEC